MEVENYHQTLAIKVLLIAGLVPSLVIVAALIGRVECGAPYLILNHPTLLIVGNEQTNTIKKTNLNHFLNTTIEQEEDTNSLKAVQMLLAVRYYRLIHPLPYHRD